MNKVFPLIHLTISVFILGYLLMEFQSRSWTKQEQLRKIKRIRSLRLKAGISEKEYEVLTPLLLETARINEPNPLPWRILKFLFSLAIAVTINNTAVNLVNAIESKFGIFHNLFPPF